MPKMETVRSFEPFYNLLRSHREFLEMFHENLQADVISEDHLALSGSG